MENNVISSIITRNENIDWKRRFFSSVKISKKVIFVDLRMNLCFCVYQRVEEETESHKVLSTQWRAQ